MDSSISEFVHIYVLQFVVSVKSNNRMANSEDSDETACYTVLGCRSERVNMYMLICSENRVGGDLHY